MRSAPIPLHPRVQAFAWLPPRGPGGAGVEIPRSSHGEVRAALDFSLTAGNRMTHLVQSAPSLTASSVPCGQATRIKPVEPHPVSALESHTFECRECGLPPSYTLELN
jgi:hypothetical protein